MLNPLKQIFTFGRKECRTTRGNAIAGIDEETLETAKEIMFEKRLKKDMQAKWKRSKGGSGDSDDVFDALKERTPDAAKIMQRVFARTVEDTVLANTFRDSNGDRVQHLTLKKAVGMDGLRDIDDDVAVASRAASPINPEGRFNVPTSSSVNHQFAERFNEAMNPVRNGRFASVLPEMILEHFANFATFIGYPACEMIGTHPTVSNACTIPGEDAIAPGYKLSFVDSEDVNDNGVPDDIEIAEFGGVKRSLGRLGAMEALKSAIQSLSDGGTGIGPSKANGEALDALARALERLAAYEEWERTAGAGEDAAQAVNEGFIKPVSSEFIKFSGKQDDTNRKSAISALSLALADLSKKEHPVLDEVRATQQRRDTVSAVTVAYETLSLPDEDWDLKNSLNTLAVAVERVGAYERYSDKNAEAMAALSGALTNLAVKLDAETKESAIKVLSAVKTAMDADDFVFADPMLAQRQAQLQARQEAEHAKVLEQERLADRQAKAEMDARNAEAKESRINELHKQKMGIIQQQALARQKVADDLAGAKGRILEAQESRANEAHQQKMDIAQKMAEQKLQHQQAQFEAQQMQALQQQQSEAEAKQKDEEKRDEVRQAAEVAKERQKYLDAWKHRADDMGMNEVCSRLSRNARIFGIGIAVPVIDGVNYEEPMSFDKVHEGAYHGFTIIEPTWIYPEVDSEDLVNPLSPTFFEPMYWAMTGTTRIGKLSIRRIHKSWMVIVRNKELPNMLRPMYYYGGIPLTQEIYEAVFCADKVMNEVPKLAMTKRSIIVKGDPNDLITNPEGVVERLQAISQVQDNFGMKFVGRNSDVMQLETSLSEFDQLIAKCNQRIAAIAKMPETKLFKTQLAGMNSAGRYEWDDYSQLLINIQNNWYKPILALHYKLDTKSRTGKVIDLKITFNPIDVPTQAEKGETESRTVQTINAAVQGGWLAPAEARTIARSTEDSMFSSISAEMPEELAQQGGGVAGVGGDQMSAMMGEGQPQMPNMGGGEVGSPLDAPEAPKEPQAPQERQ